MFSGNSGWPSVRWPLTAAKGCKVGPWYGALLLSARLRQWKLGAALLLEIE